MDTYPENLHGPGIASTQGTDMEKPGPDAPEHVKCKWWRSELMLFTREQLSGLTGFSASAIRDFESGTKETDPMARKRYQMACAAVAMGVKFDWLSASLEISRPTKLEMIIPGDE